MNDSQNYKLFVEEYIPQRFVALDTYTEDPSIEPTEYIYISYPPTFSFDNNSSPEKTRTPTLVPSSGVLTNVPIRTYPTTNVDTDISMMYVCMGIGAGVFIILFIYVCKIYEANRKKIRKLIIYDKNMMTLRTPEVGTSIVVRVFSGDNLFSKENDKRHEYNEEF